MRTLLVGYDLDSPGQNYDDLIAAIKEAGAWWHYLDSTWLVKTQLTAIELRDNLTEHIDTNDELLVIEVTGDAAAWIGFDDEGNQWLKDNL
jgi:hypothetical protein